jgi:hypothetical protein
MFLQTICIPVQIFKLLAYTSATLDECWHVKIKTKCRPTHADFNKILKLHIFMDSQKKSLDFDI